jgi:hypothetical protein
VCSDAFFFEDEIYEPIPVGIDRLAHSFLFGLIRASYLGGLCVPRAFRQSLEEFIRSYL